MRGATLVRLRPYRTFQISIHAPLAGCDLPPAWRFQSRHDISIHAPLAGCDTLVRAARRGAGNFNPRTPCGVRQKHRTIVRQEECEFQSTHPLRGATKALENHQKGEIISIHAPLAGCDPLRIMLRTRPSNFNPRTPCGVRLIDWRSSPSLFLFQSTHPLRGATCCRECYLRAKNISIHAPLAGCD